MNLYKHQTDIIEIFESKLPRALLSDRKEDAIVKLLWEAVHEANEKRTKDLEKEIEKLKNESNEKI